MLKIKIGILGCGAIGSRIARSIDSEELKDYCELSGLFDTDLKKVTILAESLNNINLKKKSLDALINDCQLMVEAVNAQNTSDIIRKAIEARTHVLAMSSGKLLNSRNIFQLAHTQNVTLMIPSGAISGIDSIKAASLKKIDKITLTTRKPLNGFQNNSYLLENHIDLTKIQHETVLFEGDVLTAVKHFPQNINVAATLALAAQNQDKITVRIITSPEYTGNSHEIEMSGDFGRMTTLTQNTICPDNPKTSYLAVLSGIQTIKDFCQGFRIGT